MTDQEIIRRICIGLFAFYDDLSLSNAEHNWDAGFAYGAVGSDGHKELVEASQRILESLKN